jgi:hypothetical protein
MSLTQGIFKLGGPGVATARLKERDDEKPPAGSIYREKGVNG